MCEKKGFSEIYEQAAYWTSDLAIDFTWRMRY
jgi:hypothetical protein